LTLESACIDDIHGRHRLALGVLGARHSVMDYVLQEYFENDTSLLVDQTRDTLHSPTASKTTYGWLGDSLDVITKYLALSTHTTARIALNTNSRVCAIQAHAL